ncbi:MAG: hypothetical protein ACYDEN_08440 [Acidimicrobiales bacterium]
MSALIRLFQALLRAAISDALAAPSAPASATGGFWSATDSAAVPVGGSGPYTAAAVGGAYGGYLGMVGDWARWQGCAPYRLAWSRADAAAARADRAVYHRGVGVGAYWFMGGPGVDPRYDGSVGEAFRWGQAQAAQAVAAARAERVEVRVLFMDVELPGSTVFDPVADNGWNTAYTSACGARPRAASVPASVDRATIDGFASWVRAHSSYVAGVYSSPQAWAAIFGTGAAATLRGVPEWTYGGSTGRLGRPPTGWCLPDGTCAGWFGGVTSSSPDALAWQWSGGGGTRNGVGDFDVIDASRLP